MEYLVNSIYIYIYVSYLIVLIEAVFAFIEKVVVALTGKVDKKILIKIYIDFLWHDFQRFFQQTLLL